ncbi:MAG: UDP-4-amino-4,6-dideoxy-N-acetyl-beta-L-altrosamine transaminase [Xanthobacteraceae bacterium]|nr:UDP-4-amino-4,6-dideoxy-N-acetyl-beta-L-altrosamine transaminase [Xanthobacteraceae bacterium]MCW5679433.1 UDP-4-amino-4,6-dideoxy-N-acetyl-beta-L-altrosamine transaminase [Xanthobacteraceae bacterium]
MSAGRALPYGRQTIEDDDLAAVAAALRSDFLTTGPLVDEFERQFAAASGAKHAVACNSGTAALHLAAMALRLGPGDTAIVPSVTFLSSANAIRMTGAEVFFADVDPDSGLLTDAGFEEALALAGKYRRDVKAAVPVHLNGRICDMRSLANIAAANNIALIEDACHALGVPAAGSNEFSAFSCFSTHPVKAIATGEGGIVTTADELAAKHMRKLRSHGMIHEAGVLQQRDEGFENGEKKPWYYEMQEIGWNYRMPDILCALGISQLKKLDRFIRRREEIARLYDRLLSPLAPALKPVPRGNDPHGLHLYALLIDFAALGTTRTKFMNALRAENIGSQVHYLPVHRQPYYRDRYGERELPGADAYYARCLSIPLFPAMTDGDVERVAAALAKLVSK